VQLGNVRPIAAEADVAVGTDRQQGDVGDAELVGGGWVDGADRGRRARLGREGEGGLEQRRAGRDLLPLAKQPRQVLAAVAARQRDQGEAGASAVAGGKAEHTLRLPAAQASVRDQRGVTVFPEPEPQYPPNTEGVEFELKATNLTSGAVVVDTKFLVRQTSPNDPEVLQRIIDGGTERFGGQACGRSNFF
jgi:hypothetical protein